MDRINTRHTNVNEVLRLLDEFEIYDGHELQLEAFEMMDTHTPLEC